jgi:hypothetical protein
VTFRSKLHVEFIDGDDWLLLSPLVYTTKRGDTFEVPAGFTSDFASIPKVFWTVVGDPDGPWAPAAVIHDFLYRTAIVPRAEADAIFREAMEELPGISWLKRWAMWAALRVGGWAAYKG